MITVMGKQYLTEKEAAERYSYSQVWFVRHRNEKDGPPYSQREKRSRVLYPLIECDEWFKNKLQMKE